MQQYFNIYSTVRWGWKRILKLVSKELQKFLKDLVGTNTSIEITSTQGHEFKVAQLALLSLYADASAQYWKHLRSIYSFNLTSDKIKTCSKSNQFWMFWNRFFKKMEETFGTVFHSRERLLAKYKQTRRVLSFRLVNQKEFIPVSWI